MTCRFLCNGTIHTLSPGQPPASAVLLCDDRIQAVGETQDLLDAARRWGAEIYDLEGCCVLPGLTDAHLHLTWFSEGLQQVQAETATLAECLERVAARSRATPEGEWITGYGWNHNVWGGGFPSACYLDAVAPDHPVALTAKSGHATWANSRALALAGIDETTPDPESGEILHDDDGRPTGILLEKAARLVNNALPESTPEGVAGAMRQGMAELNRLGLTGVHDMDGIISLRALQRLHREGAMTLRVLKSLPVDVLDAAIESGIESGLGDTWLTIGHVKLFCDGALGPCTAWMLAPYASDASSTGICTYEPDALAETVARAAQHGLACAIHAIGDRAVRTTLDALERAGAPSGGSLRHRIEHAQLVDPDDLARFADLGVIASMQPLHATSDMDIARQHWGTRCRGAYAWNSLLQAGASLAFGSDCPVETASPLAGIHAAITRRRADGTPGPEGWEPQERITRAQALAAYTVGATYAAGQEGIRGRIAPGMAADLTILDRDLMSVPDEEILDLRVESTIVGGRTVYSAGRL